VWRARPGPGRGAPGEVLVVGEGGIAVAAGEGAVVLLEVQPEARRRMSAAEFARGHPIRPGDRLGDTLAGAPSQVASAPPQVVE
ncbi:MAG: hypothetical protein QN168_15320, partial [Armatimonadota bacterium]|nr:hypothetical protein [Armatimonadota bacterium]